MGFLSNLTGLLGKGSGIIGAGIGAVSSAIQNQKNRDWNAEQAEINRNFQSAEAETARQFNAHEAALQRDWSSQEAERARDWNEEMYAKYNSLSGKISQAEQAGVNPMFAITGNAISPMSASSSAPSGASASGGAPSGSSATSSFVDLVGSMLGMSKLKAEIDNIKADTKKKQAEGEGQIITNETLRKMNAAQLENLLTSTSSLESRINLDNVTASKVSAESLKLQKEAIRIEKITDHEVKLAEAKAAIAEYESSISSAIGSIDNPTTKTVVSAATLLLEKIANIAF